MKLIVTTDPNATEFEFTTPDMDYIEDHPGDDGNAVYTYDCGNLSGVQQQNIEDALNADDAVITYCWMDDDEE